MKRKSIVILAVIILIFSCSTLYAKNEKSTATNNPFLSKHIIISEIGFQDGEAVENVYEMWIDDKGYFRSDVTAGPQRGNYMVWDGEQLYQFVALVNEVFIRNIDSNENPIPHLFLSTAIYERIKNDIHENKLIRRSATNEYFKEKIGKEGEIISYGYTLSDSFVAKSSYQINGESIHENEITLLENFENTDANLFEVNKENISVVTQP